ncbi:hypothetical protein P175DRAFT_0191740 [Aspergillus ochraceoroseus IBT 24754]|uniref:Condensation domain-containing protein n=1 Tax=Aspergillus ochraceoroseus IBT 24754 TaxID=1392256 RepID=A0A2T5LZ66_9EURO|nr:uncharacterized protein P175DRAFT_0191740 [Aspergillus ochraceoroseus IBT 24754]PTU21577.1 hypothetical protein P175DRAFT_0191740 [Aspergillus ochraceoroseus IBT 24754]
MMFTKQFGQSPGDFIVTALFTALQSMRKIDDGVNFATISNARLCGNPGKFPRAIGCFDTVGCPYTLKERGETGVDLLIRVKDKNLGYPKNLPDEIARDAEKHILVGIGRLQKQFDPPQNAQHLVLSQQYFSTLPPACLLYVQPFWEGEQVKLQLRCREQDFTENELGQIAGTFRATLKELIAECRLSDLRVTPSDFPLLNLTYVELDDLVSTRLSRVSPQPLRDTDAIFACTPRQEAMLVAPAIYPELYQCSFVVRIRLPAIETSLDFSCLREAWGILVQRHEALRTVFIESSNRPGHFDQVISRNVPNPLVFIGDGDESIAHHILPRRPVVFPNYKATHHAMLCKTSKSSAYLRLDMSHAIVDGQSAEVLLRDLSRIYGNQSLDTHVMPYYDFVNCQQQLVEDTSVAYWSKYLAGADPSYFPINGDQSDRRDLGTVHQEMKIKPGLLGEFCGSLNITVANICQVAWALVLRSSTGLEDICFSYATSGREAPLKGINNTVGAFLNAVICRIQVPMTASVPQVLRKAKFDFVDSLQHPHFYATDNNIQSGQFGRLKSNTLMSCQRKVTANTASTPEERRHVQTPHSNPTQLVPILATHSAV